MYYSSSKKEWHIKHRQSSWTKKSATCQPPASTKITRPARPHPSLTGLLNAPTVSSSSLSWAYLTHVVRKLDFYLLPFLSLMYFFNSVDRSNLGNAKTDGMDKDLGFKGEQYSLLILLFYIPNGLCDLPLNMLTKKWSGRVMLPGRKSPFNPRGRTMVLTYQQ